MTHDEAFLQAIIENPDDDAPRLLYADWLEDRGDPRGEFIRVQCALARMDEWDPRRWDLEVRQRELQTAHESEWLGACHEALCGWTFCRGFLQRIVLRAPAMLEWPELLFRCHPIHEVRLEGLQAAQELLPGFIAQPFVRNVRALDLSGNYLNGGVMRCLAASEYLTGLTTLVLSGNLIGTEGVRILTSANWLAGLRSLNLAKNHVGAAGVEALAGCEALCKLTSLCLDSNRLGAVGVQMLASSRALPALTRLSIQDTQVSLPGIRALASSPHLSGLTELYAGKNPVRNDGFALLLQSAFLTNLRQVGLASASLVGAGSVGTDQPTNIGWVGLDLSGNRLGERGAAWLAQRPGLRDLTSLNLSDNEIGDGGTRALAQSEYLARLEILGLAANGLRRLFKITPQLQTGIHVRRLSNVA